MRDGIAPCRGYLFRSCNIPLDHASGSYGQGSVRNRCQYSDDNFRYRVTAVRVFVGTFLISVAMLAYVIIQVHPRGEPAEARG
jgi:hypothetical protein